MLSLALGIGATAAVFAAVNGILWSPYPYRGSGRMMVLTVSRHGESQGRLFQTPDEFRNSIAQAKSLDGGILWDDWTMATKTGGLAESIPAGKLSPNAFAFLGIEPLLGQTFRGDAFTLASEPKLPVVLSYKYWQSRFGGSPHVIGQALVLDQQDYTVIGVMPERFRFLNSDVYVPLTMPGGPYFTMARVKAGVSSKAASAELESLLQNYAQRDGDPAWRDLRIHLVGMRDDAVGGFNGVLAILTGAVGLLLAIGCANVSILLVARGIERRHELAVRGAIGASAGRILRQLLTESLALSTGGAALGIAAGYGFLASILRYLPDNLVPKDIQIRIDPKVLAITTLVAVATGIAAGVWPALRLSRLKPGFQAHGGIGRSGGRRMHALLMTGQVALTVVLLAGAGAALRTFLRLTSAQLGYDPRGVTALSMNLAYGGFPHWAERVSYYDRLRASVISHPEVETAAIQQGSPLPVLSDRSRFEIPGRRLSPSDRALLQHVSSEYFGVLRVPLLAGRAWDHREEMRPAHVAVINQAMAKRYWPGANPVGQRINVEDLKQFSSFQADSPGNDQWVEIIGVTGDTRNRGLGENAAPEIDVPYTLITPDGLTMLIRSRAPQAAAALAARQKIAEVNGEQGVYSVTSLEERLKTAGWARQQFVASLFLLIAGLALVLAAVGVYSVVACSVSQRAREFALRSALGASRGDILSSVFRSMGRALALGLAGGLAVTAVLDQPIARWTESRLWQPETLAPASAVLLLAGLAAILIPARRAASADPMDVLRDGA